MRCFSLACRAYRKCSMPGCLLLFFFYYYYSFYVFCISLLFILSLSQLLLFHQFPTQSTFWTLRMAQHFIFNLAWLKMMILIMLSHLCFTCLVTNLSHFTQTCSFVACESSWDLNRLHNMRLSNVSNSQFLLAWVDTSTAGKHCVRLWKSMPRGTVFFHLPCQICSLGAVHTS